MSSSGPSARYSSGIVTPAVRSAGVNASVHDSVHEVRDSRCLDHAEQLEFHFGSHALEEPRATAKDDWDDVQLQDVDEAGSQVLVDDIGPTADEDVAVPR